MAAGAQFTVAGQGSGQRTVAARDFFLGYRKVDMAPHEVLVKVRNRSSCVTADTAASQAIGLGLIGWLSQGGTAVLEVLVKVRAAAGLGLHALGVASTVMRFAANPRVGGSHSNVMCMAAILGCTSRLRLLGTGLANSSHVPCAALPRCLCPSRGGTSM